MSVASLDKHSFSNLTVTLDFLDEDELHKLIRWIQTFVERRGFKFYCTGSCAKGPNGVWINATFEFETAADYYKFSEKWKQTVEEETPSSACVDY